MKAILALTMVLFTTISFASFIFLLTLCPVVSFSTSSTKLGFFKRVIEHDKCPSSFCFHSLRLTKQHLEEISATESNSRTINIQKPIIHWAVPIQKIGWQDEDGKWFDDDGPRNGPPQNYWRQRLDEKSYQQDMDLVDKLLLGTDVEDVIRHLATKNSVRRPSCHRNLLGTWAPLYLSGTKVASSNDETDDSGGIEVTMTIDIFRTNGPKFAPKNNYGTFYASLVEGEELTVRSSDGLINTVFCVSVSNEPISLGTTASRHLLHFGGITYISDYLLLQRNSEGLYDIWLRCDEVYLGKTEG